MGDSLLAITQIPTVLFVHSKRVFIWIVFFHESTIKPVLKRVSSFFIVSFISVALNQGLFEGNAAGFVGHGFVSAEVVKPTIAIKRTGALEIPEPGFSLRFVEKGIEPRTARPKPAQFVVPEPNRSLRLAYGP